LLPTVAVSLLLFRRMIAPLSDARLLPVSLPISFSLLVAETTTL